MFENKTITFLGDTGLAPVTDNGFILFTKGSTKKN